MNAGRYNRRGYTDVYTACPAELVADLIDGKVRCILSLANMIEISSADCSVSICLILKLKCCL